MKSILTYLLALTSLSAFGQATFLGSADTKNVFTKMDNEQAADLSLRSLVGNCKSLQLGTAGANYMYSLRYTDGGKTITERFGRILSIQSMPHTQFLQLNPSYAPAAVNLSTKLKNLFFIPEAHAQTLQLPQYAIPHFSRELILSAKGQLGQRIKQLVATNKCGTVNFESFQRSLPQMQSDVTFYMENNVLTCTAADFQRRVRKPNSCDYEVVHSALPKEACKLLYQIQSTKSGRNTKTGTAVPVIAQLTPTIRNQMMLDTLLAETPELALVAESAQFIKAEHVIPLSVVELLESQAITAANFDNNSLSSAQKAELVNLVATYDAIKNSSEHVQFSSNITTVVNNIRTKANAYALAQNVIKEIWAIPTKQAIGLHLDTQLAPISQIFSTQFVYNLNCVSALMEPVMYTSATAAASL